jgi:AGCS family alanine or glycine:cation symporter
MPLLSKVYAVFCLLSTLGMGNMTQANSITASLKSGFHSPPLITGIVVVILCFLVIKSGVKGISKVSEIIVPVMTISYLLLSFGVLFIFGNRIIPVINLIFKEAFSLKAISGYGMFRAMRYGISRGVFSNEAGLGSSTIIHSETENTTPENQGMWAMFEVFCDTIFLCTIMALVILVSGTFTPDGQLYGAELSVASYSVLGELGKKGIAVLTAVFSFASLLGCSFYGEKSAEYLFTHKAVKPYKFIYLLLALLGSIVSPQLIWSISDIFNGLMAVPNLFALFILRKEVEFPKSFCHKKRNALSLS